MGTPADRLNRVMLALLGLLLLAGGVVALVRSFGGFGDVYARDSMITRAEGRYVDRNGAWLWTVVAVAAGVIALLALRWLLAQLRSDRVSSLELESDDRLGTTTLQSSAVTSAVCEEIESYRGVSSAKARLLHSAEQPDLVLEVSLDERADIAATRSRIESEAITHARQALDKPGLSAQLTLKPAAAGPR